MTPNTRSDLPEDPAVPVNDPGGAHAKGYSADPLGADDTAPDPIPLADAKPGGIRVPERDNKVQPTGRIDPDPKELIVSGGH